MIKINWQSICSRLARLRQNSFKTPHNGLVTMGLLVGAIYLPFWIGDVLSGTLHGAASILMVALIGLGAHRLWQKRLHLATLTAEADDRLIGHLLIGCGVAIAPFCFFSEWAQKLCWMLILVGIASSTWGIQFFRFYALPTFLIGIGLFPQPTLVGQTLWQTFTPPHALENFMAWSGGLGLRAIGQSVNIIGAVITLPGGSVRVDWGCSGFDMVTIMVVASLVMGLFFQQSWQKILLMISIGAFLALLANIPRIMLMAYAHAVWGKSAFHFWHGTWGGQIFSTILFTIYYYAVMAIIKRRSRQTVSSTVNNP
jgi:exosortase/archaeosortase family protein